MTKLTIIVSLALMASVQAKCDKGCSVPVKHYEELGCEPVYEKPEDCCPTYYNCTKIEGRAADKCYFQGKSYNKHEQIPNELTGRHCAASCYCEKNDWEDFTCANIECPEFFGANPVRPGCFRIYGDHCCSIKSVCLTAPFENLTKCVVDGKNYYEGERFDPPGSSCLTCVCKPNFEGKFESPFCTPLDCGTELRYSARAKQKHVPIYYGHSSCCPSQWQWPEEGDTVVPAKEPAKSDKKCEFGDKKLNIGDELVLHRTSIHSPEVKCKCNIPPLVTCIQTPDKN